MTKKGMVMMLLLVVVVVVVVVVKNHNRLQNQIQPPKCEHWPVQPLVICGDYQGMVGNWFCQLYAGSIFIRRSLIGAKNFPTYPSNIPQTKTSRVCEGIPFIRVCSMWYVGLLLDCKDLLESWTNLDDSRDASCHRLAVKVAPIGRW